MNVVRTLNEKKLSKRLQAVCNQLILNKRLADIGTDHAYLPCYAYLKGMIPFAIGTEVNKGPFHSAKSLVRQLELAKYIKIRFGDGLSVLREGEVEQVTVTGMGGGLITNILGEGKAKLKGVERLILQPNVAADNVRKWLYENNWTLINELILEEDGVIYEILVAEYRIDTRKLTEKDFLFGPFLKREKSDIFQKKWKTELKKLKRIVANLEKATNSDEVAKKRLEIEKTMQFIREALS